MYGQNCMEGSKLVPIENISNFQIEDHQNQLQGNIYDTPII